MNLHNKYLHEFGIIILKFSHGIWNILHDIIISCKYNDYLSVFIDKSIIIVQNYDKIIINLPLRNNMLYNCMIASITWICTCAYIYIVL